MPFLFSGGWGYLGRAMYVGVVVVVGYARDRAERKADRDAGANRKKCKEMR
jgi:hypothetical protein